MQPPEPKGTILIVDDTQDNLRLLSSILSEHGYKARFATSGERAISIAQKAAPDLILLDIMMPGLNGYEVCRLLKSDPDTAHIPVIFISAINNTLDIVEAFRVGGTDYITKPFQLEEVLARVENQITIKILRNQLEHQVQELQQLTSRLQRELSVAANIQQGFLPPSIPPWQALRMVCHTQPAREIGGDFYVYHSFDAHHYVVAVGDISDKGLPAALLMSASVASFRSLMHRPFSPAAFLDQMDEALTDYTRTTGQNCALVCAEITKSPTHNAWQVRVANAGCISPLLRRRDGTTFWIDIGGLPLGVGMMGEDTLRTYSEQTVMLNPGDMLVLSSDGLLEAFHPTSGMFGFERLASAIRSGPVGDVAQMVDHLQTILDDFMEQYELRDDITMAVIGIEE